MIVLSNSFKHYKTILEVLFICLVTILVVISTLFKPMPVHAANRSHVSTQVVALSQTRPEDIEKQSTILYEHLHHLKRSQAEIDAALLQQFGLRRIDVNESTTATPFTSTNSAISLPTTSIYASRGATFIYSDFNWNCGASCYGDSQNYNDVFGAWLTRNIPLSSSYLSVTETAGITQTYINPTNFSQAGADYSQNANFWLSGVLEMSFKGGFPSGCTEIFTKYTHGWTSSEPTSVTISAGFPPSFGVSVTYSQVNHSWQATGPTPARHGC